VVRVSGPEAIRIAGALAGGGERLAALPSRRLRRVALSDPVDGAPLDEALVAVMRAPRSYTGEDVVELSCHGSPALLGAILMRLREAGARLAEPGEFTRRAFLNGRMDLARAEAVALLVSARTERAARLAVRALTALGPDVQRMREALVEVVAGLDVRLDFPEENVGLAAADAAATLARWAVTVDGWRRAGRRGRVVHAGLTIAIVGAPNAGKSTLLNALAGSDRAIVSPVPGTTRDVVETTMAIAGVPVRLLDTAGLGVARDAIEAEGMRRSRKAMDESDVVLVVFDGSEAPGETRIDVALDTPRVLVRSKADLPPHPAALALEDAVAVAAIEGRGIDALVQRLERVVGAHVGNDGDEGALVASLRQLEILDALAASLRRGADALGSEPLEVALVDLHAALAAISELLGIEVGDAVLDRVFSSFCLGK
jgi:tRNA modification GTPase